MENLFKQEKTPINQGSRSFEDSLDKLTQKVSDSLEEEDKTVEFTPGAVNDDNNIEL